MCVVVVCLAVFGGLGMILLCVVEFCSRICAFCCGGLLMVSDRVDFCVWRLCICACYRYW